MANAVRYIKKPIYHDIEEMLSLGRSYVEIIKELSKKYNTTDSLVCRQLGLALKLMNIEAPSEFLAKLRLLRIYREAMVNQSYASALNAILEYNEICGIGKNNKDDDQMLRVEIKELINLAASGSMSAPTTSGSLAVSGSNK